MRAKKLIGIVAVFAIAAVLIFRVFVNNEETVPKAPTSTQNNSDSSLSTEPVPNAVVAEVNDVIKANPAVIESDSATQGFENSNNTLSLYPPLAAYEIGNEPINDEDLIALVRRLNNDPALMTDLINELRAETNPRRLELLVFILGSTANSAVLPAAEEMIYSGISDSRDVGLDLLSRIAPNNPEALAIASNVLVSETEPDVLIATINVMAQPAAVTPEFRDSLIAQLTPLSTHESTAVRGFSVATLARLTNDPSLSSVFYSALYDTEPAVRSSGVYAFSSFPYHTAEASQKLLDMAEDETENVEVRRGAILALSNNSPDELTQMRIDAMQLQIRRQIAKQRRGEQ